MSTFHRRRPSALREISKNLCKNDESEELSASPSPSAWIKQVQDQQQSQRHTQYDDDDDDEENIGHQFAFRATDHVHEIIDDHEDSEMESDYVETEVSEEEIRNIQVPYETDVEESESQSDYTSVADQSPVHSSTAKIDKHKSRRQSMPNLSTMQLNVVNNDDEEDQDQVLRSPNAENRPPPLQEQKEIENNIEYESDHNCGSMNRSVILQQCFEETEEQEADITSAAILNKNKNKSKKQSILPPKELTFDEMSSPAPPSILRTQKKKPSAAVKKTVKDTPCLADIADNLAGFENMLRPSERERAFGSIDMEPSPLVAPQRKEPEPMTLSVEVQNITMRSKRSSRQSSYKRKHMTKNVTTCAKTVADDLENRMRRLKQILPSPAVATQESADRNTPSTKRRRSARLAKKNKSRLESDDDDEGDEDESEQNNALPPSIPDIDDVNEEEDALPPSIPHTEQSSGRRPYIDDYDDEEDDEMLSDNPPLPSTKGKKKKTKTKINVNKKESKEEEDDAAAALLFSTRKRKRKRGVLDTSLVSEGSSVSRRTRTLRSRKEETLNRISSPISDVDADDEYPTFGTPKINRSKRKSKRKKQKRKKSKTPTTKQRVVESVNEVSDVNDVDDNIVNDDIADDMYDIDDNHNHVPDEIPFDSPNVNENADEKQELDINIASDHDLDTQIDIDNDNVDLEDEDDDDGDISMETLKQQRKVRSHSKEKKKDTKTTKRKRKKNTGKEEASTKKTKKKSTKSRKKNKKKGKKGKKDKKDKKGKKDKKKKTKSKKSRKRKAPETEMSELSDSDAFEPENKRRRLSQYVVPPVGQTQAEETGCRRSKRVRFKPLAFWASERIEYTPTPLTLEKIENTEENAIIVGQKNRLTEITKRKTTKKPTNRASKKTTSKKTNKKTSKKSKKPRKKSKSPEPEMMISDNDDSDDEEPFNGNAWIYDPNTDQMSEKCVAKTAKSLNLVPLSFGDTNSNSNKDSDPVSKRVRGAKGLEEEGFSCGVLEIPPESQKHAEVSYFTEQFFVHRAEKKKLLFKVGDETEFYLSTGSMFFVPPENEYSLHNLSKTVPVKLIFTLIKNNNRGHDQEDDCNETQVSTLVSQ